MTTATKAFAVIRDEAQISMSYHVTRIEAEAEASKLADSHREGFSVVALLPPEQGRSGQPSSNA